MSQRTIQSFIHEDVREYVTKVRNVLALIESTSSTHFNKRGFYEGIKVIVFGGFVRDIIAKKEPHDVDIWIFPVYKDNGIRHFVSNNGFWESIQDLEKVLGTTADIKTRYVVPYYGCCRITINGINFDINAQINDSNAFTELPDFTCNNLYFESDGILKIRSLYTYSVDECITHIQNRLLVYPRKDFVKYYSLDANSDGVRGCTDCSVKISMYKKYFKMISYGYTPSEDVLKQYENCNDPSYLLLMRQCLK